MTAFSTGPKQLRPRAGAGVLLVLLLVLTSCLHIALQLRAKGHSASKTQRVSDLTPDKEETLLIREGQLGSPHLSRHAQGTSVTALASITRAQAKLAQQQVPVAAAIIPPSQLTSTRKIALNTDADDTFPTPVHSTSYAYDVGMVAVFKWEAPYLREWVMYHLLIGVQRLWLVSNDCDDHSAAALAVLEPFIAEGCVVVLREYECETKMQISAYNAVLDAVRDRRSVKWLAIMDIDEFIVLEEHNMTMPKLLAGFDESVAGIGLHRVIFGPSGHFEPMANQSVVASFTHHAHPFLHYGAFYRFVKMIVRPQNCLQVTDHGCSQPAPVEDPSQLVPGAAGIASTVDTLGIHQVYHTPEGVIEAPAYSQLQGMWINHYYTKSVREFMRKDERGDAKFGSRPFKAIPSRLDDMASFTVLDSIAARLLAQESAAGAIGLIALKPEWAKLSSSGFGPTELRRVLLNGAPGFAARVVIQATSRMPSMQWSSRMLQDGTAMQKSRAWPVNPRHLHGAPYDHLGGLLPDLMKFRLASRENNRLQGSEDANEQLTASQYQELLQALPKLSDAPVAGAPRSRVGLVALVHSDFELTAVSSGYFEEWIEYHMLVGVHHFWLVHESCNSPTDWQARQALEHLNLTASLRTYVDAGVLTVSNHPACVDASWHFDPISKVYTWAAQDSQASATLEKAIDWLGVLDYDEYIMLEEPSQSLPGLLSSFIDDSIGAVALDRLIFGPSGFMSPPLGSALASFTLHADPFNRSDGGRDMDVFRPKMFVRVGTRPTLCASYHTYGCSSFRTSASAKLSAASSLRRPKSTPTTIHAVNALKEPYAYFHHRPPTPAPAPAIPCFHGAWLHTFQTRSVGEYSERNTRSAYFGPEEWHGLPRGLDAVQNNDLAAAVLARLDALSVAVLDTSSPVVQRWVARLRVLLLTKGQSTVETNAGQASPLSQPMLWSADFVARREVQSRALELEYAEETVP